MTDRWQQVQSLFHGARARRPEDRAAFLDDACGDDPTLRREVESLLGQEASGFLEQPAFAAVTGTGATAQSVGRRLGHYQVQASIGAGGMGDVYRAHDTKLGRDVALKILPDVFAQDADRLARFQREAHVVASLNHPNIAQIYGLEDSDGTHALVMELVEGPTLAELIAGGHPEAASGRERLRDSDGAAVRRGWDPAATERSGQVTGGAPRGRPEGESGRSNLRDGASAARRGGGAPRGLRLDDALAIAQQIAEALEAAHEQGIIHRDLKPANIKVRADGTVKVLDFGLAKALGAPTATDSSSDIANSPTMASPAMTAQGLILGTAAYMSPEQAKGRPVDRRADVWAFGVVLYEMLTGCAAFGGDTVTETIARVIEREPDWDRLPADTPPLVRRLLARCLEKDPKRRLRHLGDAGLEIEEALAGGGSAVDRRTHGRTAIVAAAGALVGAAVLAAVLWPRGAAPAASMSIGAQRQLTFQAGPETGPSLTADGTEVVYAAAVAGNLDLYLQNLGSGNALRITTDPAADSQADVSRNREVVFRSERGGGGLYVTTTTGGAAHQVATFGRAPKWSPDGSRILFRGLGALYVMPSDGLVAQPIEWPLNDPTGRLFVVGRDGSEVGHVVLERNGSVGWLPDGRVSILNAADGLSLTVVELDTLSSTAWTTRDEVQAEFAALGLRVPVQQPHVWATGGRGLFFVGRADGIDTVWRLDVDPQSRSVTGRLSRVTTSTGEAHGDLTIAREAGRLAYCATSGRDEVWLRPLDESGRHLVSLGKPLATAANADATFGDIAPDGSWLVYRSERPGSGQGAEIRLVQGPLSDTPIDTVVLRDDPDRGVSQGSYLSVLDGSRVLLFGGPRVLDVTSGRVQELFSSRDYVVAAADDPSTGPFLLGNAPRSAYRPGVPQGLAGGYGILAFPVDRAAEAEKHARLITETERGAVLLPTMSPDGRWIAMLVNRGGSRVIVVGSPDGRWRTPVPEREWQYVETVGNQVWQDKPRWSADGRLLYFLMREEAGRPFNVGGVDFDPRTGQIGSPFQVTDFDETGERFSPLNSFGFSVGGGHLVLPLQTPDGAVFSLEVGGPAGPRP